MKKQNVVLKIVISLVLGMGALTLAPRAAHASTPCTPTGGQTDSAPCLPVPGEVCVEYSDMPYDSGCGDPDGDCVFQFYVAHIKEYDCTKDGVHRPCQSTNYVVDENRSCS